MFKQRLISGVILVILALIFIIHGGYLLLAVLGIISLIGMYEFYRVFKIEKTVGIAGYAAAVFYYLNLALGFLPDIMALIMGLLIVCMCFFCVRVSAVWRQSDPGRVFRVFLCGGDAFLHLPDPFPGRGPVSGMADLPVFLGLRYLRLLRGNAVRETQDVPETEPRKKSVEGAFGGVIGAALLTILYGFIFRGSMGEDIPYIFMMAGICAAGRAFIHGGRSGGFSDQAQL